MPTPLVSKTVIGEPEVVEDAGSLNPSKGAEGSAAWQQLKDAAIALRALQVADGSIPATTGGAGADASTGTAAGDGQDASTGSADAGAVASHDAARAHVAAIVAGIRALAPAFPHDAEYLAASVRDFQRWASEGFGIPDFLDSLVAFQPQQHRIDGIRHLVVFPMYTQNGSPDRLIEALIVETIWPEFIADLEGGDYGNRLFVSLRLIDFTPGYDTNSAVLFPETVSMREIPAFTWGAIFQDREAARYRRVVRAASEITKLELPAEAARMLEDQDLAEKTFVMWDLIHDRTHMRGDLPFDPFMIKQRMPYFLYSLEELRCDLTAFRESVAIQRRLALRQAQGTAGEAQGTAGEAQGTAGPAQGTAGPAQGTAGSAGPAQGTAGPAQGSAGAAQGSADALTSTEQEMLEHAGLVQYAVIFDRIFRFAITGSRVRNYDGLGGQLLFAWLHQRGVLHWTDTQLTFDWPEVPDAVIALGDAIDELYWRSIDRPKKAHWLAAYSLVSSVLEPNPASVWGRGLPDEVLAGLPKGYTDAVLDDEFPLSMFFEALEKKMRPVIESTAGIRASDE